MLARPPTITFFFLHAYIHSQATIISIYLSQRAAKSSSLNALLALADVLAEALLLRLHRLLGAALRLLAAGNV